MSGAKDPVRQRAGRQEDKGRSIRCKRYGEATRVRGNEIMGIYEFSNNILMSRVPSPTTFYLSDTPLICEEVSPSGWHSRKMLLTNPAISAII
jgi:hypothetical protein